MTKAKTYQLLLLLIISGMFMACGQSVSDTVGNYDYSTGKVNNGKDQNTGDVNQGNDQDSGVINVSLQPNKEGQSVSGLTLRNSSGVCYNNTDNDSLCNEEDDDIDGDGIKNTDDDDIDGDGIPNTQDDDMDGDGIPNIDDNDMDGDGIGNVNDNDMDGDGIPNFQDDDMDGDGIPNIDDNDIDGDGIKNTEDDDIDGDGIKNEDDHDMDGDGIGNTDDKDIDGDGIDNNKDDDIDGDGIKNDDDDDIDGDGTKNEDDPDPTGNGENTNPQNSSSSSGGGNVAEFTHSGSFTLSTLGGMTGGKDSTLLDFQDVRNEAIEKNADVSTIILGDVTIQLDPLSAQILAPYANYTFRLKVFYDVGEGEVMVGHTSSARPLSIQQLIDGVSMTDNSLMQTKNFASFQKLITNTTYSNAQIILEISDLSDPLPLLSDIILNYIIDANAQVIL